MPVPKLVISAAGISAPTYQQVLDGLTSDFQGIYGSDAVLTPDSQDGQFLAILALAIYDSQQSGVAAAQSFSPTYAQGVGLSSLVKINGLKRQVASHSTVPVKLVGQAFTLIENGVARDEDQNLWLLPASVTIPSSGEITVTATAAEVGDIAALPGTVNSIYTPTRGWQSVTNETSAALGAPVESDAALRLRQSISTANPAQAIVDAIGAAVANVTGVSRSIIYENPTAITDSNGIPAHSIAVVVQGGSDADVAAAIALRKPPGIQTFGTTTEVVLDPKNFPITINFFRLTDVPITVSITIKALAGFLATTTDQMKKSVAAFINGLRIGEFSYQSRLYAPANLEGNESTDATGLTQLQLDALSDTYNIRFIGQSRSGNPKYTDVTGGPYPAGTDTISVANTDDIYAGCSIQITLDNATTFTAQVTNVAGSAVDINPAVPVSRSVLTGADVFLMTDLKILPNEAASCDVDDITITVVP